MLGSVTELLRGEAVRVEERRDGWARIVTAYDSPGWVREEALGRRGGDPVAEARAYLGASYLWGGMTERGIDCSGLVHMSYRRLGLLVPRDAGRNIAFWLGGGRILHATQRDGVGGVLEEPEPDELSAKRRAFVRLLS